MIDYCTVAEEAASFLSICFCQIQHRFFFSFFNVTVSQQRKNNNILKSILVRTLQKLNIKFFCQLLALAGYQLRGVTKMNLHTIIWLIFSSSIDFVERWVPKNPMFPIWNLANEEWGISTYLFMRAYLLSRSITYLCMWVNFANKIPFYGTCNIRNMKRRKLWFTTTYTL